MPEFDAEELGAVVQQIKSQNGLLTEVREDVKKLREDFGQLCTDVAVLKSVPQPWERIQKLEEQQRYWKGAVGILSALSGLVGGAIVLTLKWFLGK